MKYFYLILPQSLLQEAESKSELSQNISAREHFVFTDNDGQVYHFTVEGNSVKDSARIPPDVSPASSTSLLSLLSEILLVLYPVKPYLSWKAISEKFNVNKFSI